MSAADLEAFIAKSLKPERLLEMESHLSSCAICRTELELYSEFQQGSVPTEEAAAVNWITTRLAARSPEILGRSDEKPERLHSWKSLFTFPLLRTASLACASILIVVSAGVYIRNHREPPINTGTGETTEWRSQRVDLLFPLGDVAEPPSELRWSPVPHAERYAIQLMEVDHGLLWSEETIQPTLRLKPHITQMLVTGKTVLWEVTALDSSGRILTRSGIQSFRVQPHR
jgi:hypothetical protein